MPCGWAKGTYWKKPGELQDAVPITLGQEFAAYAEAIGRDRWRLYKIEERLKKTNLGGTAIEGRGRIMMSENINNTTINWSNGHNHPKGKFGNTGIHVMNNNIDSSALKLLDKAEREHDLSIDEIVTLLKVKGDNFTMLCQRADRVRAKYHGKEVHLRGIIEFSNYCHRNCKYCGLRRDNQDLKRYQLTPQEIIEMALEAADLGYKTVVLQSGEDGYDADKIAQIIKEIKEKAGIAITLCVGERDYEEYKLWKESGADRYLLKHEVADLKLYHELHPEMVFAERIKRLEWLKELGYQVGSGNIIGLPGQDEVIIARDIKLFQELDLDMVGIGPFIPHQNTPLKERPAGTVEMTLKTVAVTRLLLPLAHIPATTALGTVDPEGRQKALKAGANVVMPNVTATKYRPLYEIYPAKICIGEEAKDCRQCIGGIIASLGRVVSTDYGHSLKHGFR